MIDTLKASRQLKENGFDDNQAQSIIDVVLSNNEQIATKADIENVKHDIQIDIEHLKIDIENFRQDIRIDIENVKQDIRGLKQDVRGLKQGMQSLRWLVGISLLLNTVAITGMVAILVSIANL